MAVLLATFRDDGLEAAQAWDVMRCVCKRVERVGPLTCEVECGGARTSPDREVQALSKIMDRVAGPEWRAAVVLAPIRSS